MLYNVLPPLIFFTSLGGIIVVVSRVVMRIRTGQRLQEIRQQSASASAARAPKASQFASLVGPNNKSVQAVKTRVAIFQRSLRTLAASPGRVLQHVRQRREESAAAPPAAPAAAAQTAVQPAIKPPTRRRVFASLRAAAGSRAASLRQRSAARLQQARRPSQPAPPPAPAAPAPQYSAAKPTISLSILSKAEKKATPTRHREHIARPSRRKVHPSPGQPATALERAKQALMHKEYAAAERILVPHLAGHPRDDAAYMLLGKAAALQRHWEEAAEIYEQVIKINSAHAGSRAALGRARYELGQFTKAIEALRRAHDEEPDNIAVIEYLLKIARRMDNVPMQRSLTQELAELEQNI